MDHIVEKREQIEKLNSEQVAIGDEMGKLVRAGKLNSSEFNQEKYDNLDKEYLLKAAEIKNAERELEKLQVAVQPPVDKDGYRPSDDRASESGNARAVLNRWMRGGSNSITAEENRQFVQDSDFIHNLSGALISPKFAALTPEGAGTDTSAAEGIPTDTQATLVHTLKLTGAVRYMAATMTTSTGNAGKIPQYDGKDEKGVLLDVASARSGTNPAQTQGRMKDIGGVTLTPLTFSSGGIPIANESLRDVIFNLENEVQVRAMRMIGKAQHDYFTSGTGTNQPEGVNRTTNVSETAASGAVGFDDIIDWIHQVAPAYRKGKEGYSPKDYGIVQRFEGMVGFMVSDSLLRSIRKLKDDDGTPIFSPRMSEKIPEMIYGYPYTINDELAAVAANAKKTGLFGDFSYYMIRDVAEVKYRRLDQIRALENITVFVAFASADGRFRGDKNALAALNIKA